MIEFPRALEVLDNTYGPLIAKSKELAFAGSNVLSEMLLGFSGSHLKLNESLRLISFSSQTVFLFLNFT